MTCETSETPQKTGILLVLAAGFHTPKALAEITVYIVNAIHELFSENELAAKRSITTKKLLYLEE